MSWWEGRKRKGKMEDKRRTREEEKWKEREKTDRQDWGPGRGRK